jgi:tetratricopeptide (TPR) repeat protein
VPQKQVVLLLEVGYLYMELAKLDEAKEVFEGVASLIPHSEVPHMALGHMYFSMGRFNPALKEHQQAVKLNDSSAAAHASVGETLFFLRRHEEALRSLERAIALEPEGPGGEFAKALKEAHGLGVFG